MCPGWQPRGKPAADPTYQGAPGKIRNHDLSGLIVTLAWIVAGGRNGQCRGQDKRMTGSWVLWHSLDPLWSSLWPIGHAWVSLIHTETKLAHLGLQSINIHNESEIFWPLLKWSQSIFLVLSFLGSWPAKIYIPAAKLTLSNSENCQTTLHAFEQDLGQGSGSHLLSLLPILWDFHLLCAQHTVSVQ